MMAGTTSKIVVSNSNLYQISLPTTSTTRYSIRLLHTTDTSTSYVIREKDDREEYPNVYAKVYHDSYNTPKIIILSDSGSGLNTNTGQNIASFLESTINPGHVAPYIVLTTHCHYDHICGIRNLRKATDARVCVVSSSHDKSWLTPWKNLQKHSECEALGQRAPKYKINWINDGQILTFQDEAGAHATSITVFHTPGHTPDSLSWYDSESVSLCVGDMFYEKESDETRSGSHGCWKREAPIPVIFTDDSNIFDWSASMQKLLRFVRAENKRLENDSVTKTTEQIGTEISLPFESRTTNDQDDWTVIQKCQTRKRVSLCAAHVTVETDAEIAILSMCNLMLRIQLDQVPRQQVGLPVRGTDIWLWDDDEQDDSMSSYSVQAPWNIIHGIT